MVLKDIEWLSLSDRTSRGYRGACTGTSCGKPGIATGGFCVCCFSCRSRVKYSDAPLNSFVIEVVSSFFFHGPGNKLINEFVVRVRRFSAGVKRKDIFLVKCASRISTLRGMAVLKTCFV